MQSRRNFLAVLSHVPFLGFLFSKESILPSKKKLTTPAQEEYVWGTYGKNGCHYPRLEWKLLIDCESDHLIAIHETQKQIPDYYKLAIENILKDRGVEKWQSVSN